MYVYAARNFPRAIWAGGSPVRASASQVRPFFSPAMVLDATAGPSQVTSANANEKKVWKTHTPTRAGSAVTLATPPTEQIKSATATVTAIKITGVRCSRADWRSSRIQTGFGSRVRRDRPTRPRVSSDAPGGGGGTDGVPD